METRYTKKLLNELLIYITRDHLSQQYYHEYRQGKIELSFQDCCIDTINSYLCDGFEYLDKEYQDISWMRCKQYGKDVLIDLDTIWDIFKDIVDSNLKK